MITLRPHFEGKTHVIWDWNGTLLDDVELCVDIIQGMLRKHDLAPIDKGEYLRVFRFPVVEYYKDVGFDLKKVPFEVVATDFMNAYNSRVLEASLFGGAVDLIGALRENGVCCSILSAAQETDLQSLIRHHGIEELFDHIYGLGDHYARSKIERGRQLIDAMGVGKDQIMLVGDTDHDLEVGEALGIDVLLVAGGHQSHERLSERHSRVGVRVP